jgi:hypothetical protein
MCFASIFKGELWIFVELLYFEDGGIMLLRNVRNCLLIDMVFLSLQVLTKFEIGRRMFVLITANWRWEIKVTKFEYKYGVLEWFINKEIYVNEDLLFVCRMGRQEIK